jgi:hypothetical protein
MKFLVNTFTHWEEPPRARHQVAYALAKNYKVVFIAANKVGFPKIKSVTINENLIVIKPYFFIGNKFRYRLPIINELYQSWLFKKIVHKYKDYEVINFDFTATKIFNFFTEVIYYCNDNFPAISKNGNPAFIAKYHKKCESKVVAKSKFCIGVSAILKENLEKNNPNSYEIRLASPDIENYQISINYDSPKNSIINVGLVGFIKIFNISSDVLNLLLKDDNIRLTLVGPVEDKFLDKIIKKDKLILKGMRTGKELYEEINKFDVAIVPYCSTLTSNLEVFVGTGNKMYQYFAVGKPVVVSDMAGLRKNDLPDNFIYIAQEEKDFSELVLKAHRENNAGFIRQRIEYAKNNTWEKRMDRLLEIYNEHDIK